MHRKAWFLPAVDICRSPCKGARGQECPATGWSGGGDAVCRTDGVFSTVTCAGNACAPTYVENSDKATPGAITGVTGDSVVKHPQNQRARSSSVFTAAVASPAVSRSGRARGEASKRAIGLLLRDGFEREMGPAAASGIWPFWVICAWARPFL